jgi:hypothetical protein
MLRAIFGMFSANVSRAVSVTVELAAKVARGP